MPAVTRAVYRNRKLPEAFSGFRVVHISDLHSARFGARQAQSE
jgi:predicted MPP superfamily phosphohydrolase